MYYYTLNTKKSGNQLTVEGLHRGDSGLREFSFLLTAGTEPFEIPENATATLFARLPDGTSVFSTLTVEGNRILFPLTGGPDSPSLTCLAGTVLCELRITAVDGSVITSPAFSLFVEDTLQDDSAIETESSFSALTDALTRVLDCETGLDSKISKVSATAGNIALFSEDGQLCDGGTPHGLFTFYFDEFSEYDEYNIQTLGQIIEAYDKGIPFSVVVDVYGIKYPAAAKRMSANIWRFLVFELEDCIGYEIRCSKTWVRYQSFTCFESESFSEIGHLPASQVVVAGWADERFCQRMLTVSASLADGSVSESYAMILSAVLSERPVRMCLDSDEGLHILTFSGKDAGGKLYFSCLGGSGSLSLCVNTDSSFTIL